jgi:heme oxygenase (biliverdin-IX-beta and delta-forming)
LNAAHRNACSFKGSIRSLLRSATTTTHAQVDERIAELIGQGEVGYREFLRLSAAAIRPLEESLVAANVECILPDWQERSRWAPLREDLADLGMTTPAPAAPMPRLNGEAHQFGVLYVLEGSRLGAKVLIRRLLAMPGLSPLRALRYLRHGEGYPLWHLGSGQTLADGGHRGRQDGLQVLSADVAVRSARRGMGNGHG